MKPSDSIMQIFSQIRGKDDSEKAEELVRAVMIYLDEQAESQEPKSLEEKFCTHGYSSCDVHVPCNCDDECPTHGKKVKAKPQEITKEMVSGVTDSMIGEPQEEPKKCCKMCASRWQEPSYCEDRENCPCHQKETEPKEYPVIEMMNYKIEGHIVLPRPKLDAEIKRAEEALENERNLTQITFYEGYIKGLRFIKSQE